MVRRQLRGRGIEDERVLAAMGEVPREAFVPKGARRRAYADGALPIGGGQTISQPWIVAAIAQALEPGESAAVLEVGTGSGYSTAVLALLAGHVVSIERDPRLAEEARKRLAALGVDGVEIMVGDGSTGLPGRAPFDAIAVHAAAPAPPVTLLEQLRSPGGRLVVPVAAGSGETLTAYLRTAEGTESWPICACRFVPLIGAGGYAAPRPGRRD